MKKRILLLFIFLSVCINIAILATSAKVFASPIQDMSPILSKALFSGLRKCYIGGKINPDIGSIYFNIHAIMQNDNDEDFVKLPNGYTKIEDNGLKCEELIVGYDKHGASGNNRFPGLFYSAGKPEPLNTSGQMTAVNLKDFLDGMGYTSSTPQSIGANGKCFQFSITVTKYARGSNANINSGVVEANYPKVYSTYPVCAASIIDGNIDVDKLEINQSVGSNEVLDIIEYQNKWFVMYGFTNPYGLTQLRTGNHSFMKGDNWENFVNNLYSDLSGQIGIGLSHGPDGAGNFWSYSLGIERDLPYGDMGTTTTTWSFPNTAIAANTAIKYLSLSTYSDNSNLRFTLAERTILYQTYLNNVYKIVAQCNETNADLRLQYEANGYFLTRIIKDGTFNDDCYVQPTENISYNTARGYYDDKGVNGLTDDLWFSQVRTFEEILNAVKYASDLTPEEIAAISGTVGSAPSVTPPGTPGSTPQTPPEEVVDPCMENSEGAGWIFCQIINGLGNFMKEVYETTIQPFLKIDAQLLAREQTDASGNSIGVGGTFQAWSVFQNIANILFVILLLVVVFSQLTGFGIDNYGIKKILPKLIITALLINLSYIICQLAVDISNILGFSINATLTSIANSVSIDPTNLLSTATANIANTATLVAAIVGGLTAFFAITLAGWAVIVPLLFTLISGAIAIFFLFVLLGVRKAGVIILVALSPLAFVCYALPNTKKLFDKWVKMLQGLLLMFPICGLLIGGSYLTSRILLSSGGSDFFIRLIALLLLVIPFFFLPMLLKGCFAAMGNIGAKINGFGQGLNKRIVGRGRPAFEKSRAGQRLTRGRDYRLKRRAEDSKFRTSEFEKAQSGAYTGNDMLLRARSRINEQRAASRIPIWGTNAAAQGRKKRYRHKNAQGQYDGSVSSVGVNMQLQGLMGGNVVQGEDGDVEVEYGEPIMEVVRDEQGNIEKNADGTNKMREKTDNQGNVVRKVVKRTRRDNVNATNVFEAHRGGMTSAGSMQTFDKWVADMNSSDIENAGDTYDNMRNSYEEMSRLGQGGESNQVQAEKMYDSMMAQYAAIGRTGDDARQQVEQQLGFSRDKAGSISGLKLHQMKDEARRRASEMGKRRTEAGKEATIAAMGQNNSPSNESSTPATGSAPAGGGGSGSGGSGST